MWRWRPSKGLSWGQDDVTDLLVLSFSATDYVGHRVGPHAQETMDMYLRLDAELARLFDALDDLVGPGAWTVFLSADHGGANVPSHVASLGMPADYWKPGNLMDEVEVLLQDRFGFTPRDQPWILRQSNDQVFLNHDLLHQRGMDRNAMARFVAERCAPHPGLSKAIAACDAPALAATDPVVERLVRGHRPGHSGDVFLVPQPGWIDYGRTGTTHGSAFAHDTHVPALFLGCGVPHGETFNTTYIRDLAPRWRNSCRRPTPTAPQARRSQTCSTPGSMSIQVTVTRDVAAQTPLRRHVPSVVRALDAATSNLAARTIRARQLRPVRDVGEGRGGGWHGNAAVKADLHSWHVPAGVNRVSWLFHADILNAGSTCVESDLFYVNPVNCFITTPAVRTCL